MEITLIFGIIIFMILICVSFALSIYGYIKRSFYIKNFNSYISVFEYHMEKAYDLVHKDKILAYSLDAYRIPDDEYESISQDFIRLVQKYLGPTILKEIIRLYGNEETFLFICLDYFSRRYEDDEIRRTALDNLQSEEQV